MCNSPQVCGLVTQLLSYCQHNCPQNIFANECESTQQCCVGGLCTQFWRPTVRKPRTVTMLKEYSRLAGCCSSGAPLLIEWSSLTRPSWPMTTTSTRGIGGPCSLAGTASPAPRGLLECNVSPRGCRSIFLQVQVKNITNNWVLLRQHNIVVWIRIREYAAAPKGGLGAVAPHRGARCTINKQ